MELARVLVMEKSVHEVHQSLGKESQTNVSSLERVTIV